MKKFFATKLPAALLLLVMVFSLCAALAEETGGEQSRMGGPLYHEFGELTDRGGTHTTYTKSGALKTGKGNTVTFTIRQTKKKKVDNYVIARLMKDDGTYWAVYASDSATMTYELERPGSYRLYVNYADGDFDYTDSFTVTGTDYAVQEAKRVAALCPAGDDYDRALWLHDYLAANTYYDSTYANHGAEGVLLRGYGVCQSYAEAYELLLKYAGISVKRVLSEAQNHEWNVIRLNGRWYMTDVTWDTFGKAPAGEGTAAGECYHRYFAVPTSNLSYDHYGFKDKWSCTSVTDSFYMREGYGARIVNALADQLAENLDAGNTGFTLDAQDAVYSEKIGEELEDGTYYVRGDMAAELASVLLNQSVREDSAGNGFYLTASHQASSYNRTTGQGTKYTEVYCGAAASSGSCASGVNWRYENDTLTLSGTGAVPDYSVGKAPWKAGYTGRITSVVIGDEIITVGAAFRDCTNVTTVTIPKSVTEMSSVAFKGCKKLKLAKVVCGTAGLEWAQELGISCQASGRHPADREGTCRICGIAFGKSGAGILRLPAFLVKLGAKAFSGSSAKTLVIPEDCEGIPADAFAGCGYVTTLLLPAALEDEIPENIEEQLTDLVVMTY